MVPLKPDYFITDLIRDMDLPLIIVSRLTLGTLNHTLLTLKTAQSTGIEIAGVILNRSDNNPLNDVEKGQAHLIHELSGVPVIGECPFINPVSVERFDNQLAEEIAHWRL